jgi:hypothetical protein
MSKGVKQITKSVNYVNDYTNQINPPKKLKYYKSLKILQFQGPVA